MSRSFPKINIPTVEEIESSDASIPKKTSAFLRFRQEGSSAAGTSSKGNQIEEFTVSVKRKRQEDSSVGRKRQEDSSGGSKRQEDSSIERIRQAEAIVERQREEEDKILEDLSSGDTDYPFIQEGKKIPEPRASGSAIIVSGRQRGNPLLRFLRNVPYEFGETKADYVLSESCCALFLSLKFHKLHPDYVHDRLKCVGHVYSLQVLLVQVDIPEPSQALRELNTICFNADWTLMLAWNPEEAAELLESYKIYQNKPPDFLMGRQEVDPRAKLIDLLTTMKSITRTDAANLITTFGSLKNMVEASEEQLALCPGLGLKKAKRLYQAFGAAWRYGKEENGHSVDMIGDSELPGASSTVDLSPEIEIENEDLFEAT